MTGNMDVVRRLGVICLVGWIGCIGVTCKAQSLSESRCAYEASVTLEASGRQATATTLVTYRNDGSAALDELVFHFELDRKQVHSPAAGSTPATPKSRSSPVRFRKMTAQDPQPNPH